MKCKKCGRKAMSELCFFCKPKKRLAVKRNPSKAVKSEEMRDFFLSIWKKRNHRSEVSGDYIYGSFSTLYFHHILEKHKHPELAFCDDNLILVTPTEHMNVHLDMYRYEEINKRRNALKLKYEIP